MRNSKESESPAAPDPAAAAAPQSGPLDELVDVWFAKHFHGMGALLDERLYNHVYAAKDDLKAELRKL